MELLFIIVQEEDYQGLASALVKASIRATRFQTEGIYLNKNNITLMACIAKDREQEILELVRQNCTERTEERQVWEYNGNSMAQTVKNIKIGGATIFITDMDRMVRY